MATISITIPDEYKDRVLDGFSYQFGYQDLIDDLPNPETKAKFCKRMLAKVIKDAVKSWEAVQAAEAARETALSNVEQITIT